MSLEDLSNRKEKSRKDGKMNVIIIEDTRFKRNVDGHLLTIMMMKDNDFQILLSFFF